jgi:hypothetical protein
MGTVEITVGGSSVVKVQTYLVASGAPVGLVAPVVIVAVYKVLAARRLVGVKVALVPRQLTVPATTAKPGAGPVTVKVVAGEVSVAQFIASLKVAVST